MSDHTAAQARNGTPVASGPAASPAVAGAGDADARLRVLPRIASEVIAHAAEGGSSLAATARDVLQPVSGDPALTRAWLTRASFALFAVVVVMSLVLSALGLLGGTEVMAVLAPVLTLTGVLVGVTLVDRGP